MSDTARRCLLALTWAAVAAVAVCQVVFPPFLHFMSGYAPWWLGLATGWLWHGLWTRLRGRSKTPS
jgi:hypothetical protein